MALQRQAEVSLNKKQQTGSFGDECRLRVFENWVLRRIFGSKRDE
jgi:hypothetical protein